MPSGLSALALSKRFPRHLEQSIFSFPTLLLESLVASRRKTPLIGLDAGCLNRVAGIAMSEVQRATAGASTCTAKAPRSGGVLFVHGFGATLNAHVDLHFCMLDGVVAPGRQRLAFRGAQVYEACVDQALVWCGEWCELPNPDCRHCSPFACYAYQISANTKLTRSLT